MDPHITSSDVRKQYEVECRLDRYTKAHAHLEVSAEFHEEGAVRLSATGRDQSFISHSTLRGYLGDLAHKLSGEITVERTVPIPRSRFRNLGTDLNASTARAAMMEQARYKAPTKRNINVAVNHILKELERLVESN